MTELAVELQASQQEVIIRKRNPVVQAQMEDEEERRLSEAGSDEAGSQVGIPLIARKGNK